MKSTPEAGKLSGKGSRAGHATRERILAAAERLFAAHGFDGVSLRSIAAAADAQLALLHYHFGSKLDLYRAIWVHRFGQPALDRAVVDWSDVDFARPAPTVVRELVERFLAVPMTLTSDSGTRNFLMIVRRESSDPKAGERGLLREFTRPITRKIDAAFAKALPGLGRRDIEFRAALMTAAMQVILDDGTMLLGADRSGKPSRNERALLSATIDFIVAGWLQEPGA